MSTRTPDDPCTGTGSGWLGLVIVASAVAAWFSFAVLAPTSEAPERAAEVAAVAIIGRDERRVAPWTVVPRGADSWTFKPGTATVSPYDVLVAMADLEALGDRLALAQAPK